MAAYLRYRDDRVGMASILTLEKLGPQAASVLGTLQGLAADSSLAAERRDAAKRAADAISRQK